MPLAAMQIRCDGSRTPSWTFQAAAISLEVLLTSPKYLPGVSVVQKSASSGPDFTICVHRHPKDTSSAWGVGRLATANAKKLWRGKLNVELVYLHYGRALMRLLPDAWHLCQFRSVSSVEHQEVSTFWRLRDVYWWREVWL